MRAFSNPFGFTSRLAAIITAKDVCKTSPPESRSSHAPARAWDQSQRPGWRRDDFCRHGDQSYPGGGTKPQISISTKRLNAVAVLSRPDAAIA